MLSDAQLETVIYAGEAHGDYLAGAWTVDETCDLVLAAPDEAKMPSASARASCSAMAPAPAKAASRPGSSSTTGSRAGARRSGSPSDKLLEDAQRDWSALGMERLLVTPLSRFPKAPRSVSRNASFSPPMPRYGPTTAVRSFRGSSRSSNGWAPISTE
ncbi:MAG: hypothetical protein HPM95_11910 [Alphaproteobacteria bacterium]|nr:hypothetical protein [Alphaproteobacteria bacterium]